MSKKGLIDRIFGLEEINGELCPTYMFRWRLLRLPWFQIYLHHFVGDDWAGDRHDHPKRFVSIGLSGEYVEETPEGERIYRAPWIRTFPATHTHRIRLSKPEQDCWTVVIALRAVRDWGFWHAGRWIHWELYVGSATATKMKSCPD
jgi:hypothetical protein